jgi:hypothetical protein
VVVAVAVVVVVVVLLVVVVVVVVDEKPLASQESIRYMELSGVSSNSSSSSSIKLIICSVSVLTLSNLISY